ncbi:WD40 repeat domain-containing protein [Streptomyces sp. GQFP]|uniref:WD40 repeat domain-containing protein n=1 Tax=Streptomyces sp. GQFP TaxID=2907545 RepID=UPI001F2AF550|nr:WD40 repeat domain-containing protein [Streptomyces sp. GQFP]UIX34824.1 WD40 repeat domain-containing protein [Streptomyces sp. GQFP]
MTERSDHVSREANSSPEPASWQVDWTCGSASDPRLLRSLNGHDAPVVAVATAVVEGRPVVVSASRDATVCVWDLTTGDRLHTLTAAPPDPMSSLSPELLALATVVVDGQPLVLTCHADRTARLWDPATGRSVGELALGMGQLVLDGRQVMLTVGADRTLGVWDQETGGRLGVFPHMVDIGVLDGREVVVTCPPDHPPQVWDLATGREVGECLPAEGPTGIKEWEIAVTKEEGGRAGRVWDMENHVLLAADLRELLTDAEYEHAVSVLSYADNVSTLTVVDGRVVVVDTHYDGPPELVGDLVPVFFPYGPSPTLTLEGRGVALAVGVDDTLRFWDLPASPMDSTGPDGTRSIRSIPLEAAAGKELTKGGPGEHVDLASLLSARTNGLVVAESASEIRVRDAYRSLLLGDTPVSLVPGADGTVTPWHALDPTPAGSVLTGHTDRVWAIDSAEVGARTLAVTTSRDRTVRVWDLATGEQQGEPLTGHTGQVWAVATVVVDGRCTAVTAGEDHAVRTWDITTAPGDGGRLRTGHTESVLAVATAVLDGVPVVVTAGADHTVRTWNLTTGSQASDPLSAEVSAMATAMVGGAPVVVTATPDATLHMVELATGRTIHPPSPSGHGRVLAIASATLDGLPVALTAGSDRVVGVWDLTTGQPLVPPLTGHSSRVTAVATAVLDGRPVAVTGSWDKTVRLWDLATAQQLGEPLTGHTDWVTAVATATLDGVPVAISKARDRTIRVWNLSTGRQIHDAQVAESGSSHTLAVSATSDGGLVAAYGEDRTVRFHDLTAGHPAGPDHLLPSPVHALAAAPGGRFAVGFGREVGVLSRPS